MQKLLFGTLALKALKCGTAGKPLLVCPQPAHPAAPTDSSALSVASVPPCDTSQGELPGNSTTSPLLLINFLKWPNHTEQFYRSSRNISGCPGEQAPTDAFFPGQSRCARGSGCRLPRGGRNSCEIAPKAAGGKGQSSLKGRTPPSLRRFSF